MKVEIRQSEEVREWTGMDFVSITSAAVNRTMWRAVMPIQFRCVVVIYLVTRLTRNMITNRAPPL